MATVTGNFTGTGNSSVLSVRRNDELTYNITGTFVATIIFEKSQDAGASWTQVERITAARTASQITAEQELQYRFRCTAYTSGTATYTVADVVDVYQEIENREGEAVLTVTETGTTIASTTIATGESILADSTEYSGTDSYQPIAPDLNLAAAAGSNDGADPSFLAAVMGNVLGATLTDAANYLGGVIGHYSVTGTKATTYPAGAVLGGISDGVTEADGAFVAYIDGDGSQTIANAAFKAMMNNSTGGSGFNYGLDLFGAAHDGYNELAILKAAIRLDKEVCILQGAGAPTNAVTGANFAQIGSTYLDRTNGNAYINRNTKASPTWRQIAFIDVAQTFSAAQSFTSTVRVGTTTGGGDNELMTIGLEANTAGALWFRRNAAHVGGISTANNVLTLFGGTALATHIALDSGGVSTLQFHDGGNVVINTTTGTKIGTAVGQKIGFWNATPVVQPSGATQAAPAAYATGVFGLDSNANMQALYDLVVAMRTALVNTGIIKGAA